jgi:mycothiol synthase
MTAPDAANDDAESDARQQLHMVWPRKRLELKPEVHLPEDYELRQFGLEDAEAYVRLMQEVGFEGWDRDRLASVRERVIGNGFFIVEHSPTGRIAATAVAVDNPGELHPAGGELGWVAADPKHRGKGLGLAVCAAVTARLIEAGYREIYLKTDDWRLPAIKTYLKLGYEPLLYAGDMAKRWRQVRRQLSSNRYS